MFFMDIPPINKLERFKETRTYYLFLLTRHFFALRRIKTNIQFSCVDIVFINNFSTCLAFKKTKLEKNSTH